MAAFFSQNFRWYGQTFLPSEFNPSKTFETAHSNNAKPVLGKSYHNILRVMLQSI